MRFLGSVRKDLRANGLRNVLTAATMLLGVLAVVSVNLVGSIAKDIFVAQEEQLYGREATFSTLFEVSQGDPDQIRAIEKGIDDKIGPQNAATSISSSISLSMSAPGSPLTSAPPQLVESTWTSGSITTMQRLPVVSGQLYGDKALPPTIVVNEAAAALFGYGPHSTVRLRTSVGNHPWDFEITGVVADGSKEPRAYGNLLALLELMPDALDGGQIEIRVNSEPTSLAVVQSVVRDVASRAGVTKLGATTRSDTVQRVLAQIATLQTIFTGTAILVLGIAAIGLLNVGLASVRERSRELVIRRAVGARRRDVFGLVLGSSVAVGLGVGVFAGALAFAGYVFVVPALIPTNSAVVIPPFPILACAFGVAASVMTAAIGGLVPAISAARLPVALALRQ